MAEHEPVLDRHDEHLLRRASGALARTAGSTRQPAEAALYRARVIARRRRTTRVALTALVVAAVVAAIVVPITVLGHPKAAPLAPAHQPHAVTPTTPVPSATTTVPSSAPTTTTPSTTAPPSTTTTTTPAQPSGTTVSTYDPFGSQGTLRPTLTVTQQTSGTCVSSGVAGAGSYRCFAGSAIWDPCFAPTTGAGTSPVTVACPVTGPTTGQVVEMSVPSLPSTSTATGRRAWAMQLADGQMCTFVSAAWGALGPYACTKSAATNGVADCHSPVTTSAQWTAPCQATLTTASPFATQPVVAAWT